jgi:hypothetical protein
MSSSTKTILSKNSAMNNNERKRPLSSSIRLSPATKSSKRRGLSSSSIPHQSTNHHLQRTEHTDRILTTPFDMQEQTSQCKPYRPMASPSSSTESNRSLPIVNHSVYSNDINQDYLSMNTSRSLHDCHSFTIDNRQDMCTFNANRTIYLRCIFKFTEAS